MRSTLLVSTALILIACTSSPKPNTSPWQDFGYDGMAEKINRIAGTGSINCGIRNHIDPDDPVNSIMTPEQSTACVKKAIESKAPFRYGSIRIPTDSYLFEALVLSDSMEYWTIKYDYMIDGSSHQHIIQRCNSIAVDFKNMSYSGKDCHDVSDNDWFADIKID